MKQTIKSILAFAAVLLCGGAWAEKSISINFCQNDYSGSVTSDQTTAIGTIPTSAWNNTASAAGAANATAGAASGGCTVSNLKVYDGSASAEDSTKSVRFGVSGMANIWFDKASDSTLPGTYLHHALCHRNGNNNEANIYVSNSGTDFQKYDVIVYLTAANSNNNNSMPANFSPISVNDLWVKGDATVDSDTKTVLCNASDTWGSTPVTSENGGTLGVNAIRVNGLTGALHIKKAAQNECGISAIQIIENTDDKVYTRPMYNDQLAGAKIVPEGTYGSITVENGGIKATTYASQTVIASGNSSPAAGLFAHPTWGYIQPHTLTMWFKFDALPTSDTPVYGFDTDGGSNSGYRLAVLNNGQLRIGKHNPNGTWNGYYTINENTFKVVAGTWYHLAVSVNRDTSITGTSSPIAFRVYINGSQVYSLDNGISADLGGNNFKELFIGAGVTAGGLYIDRTVLGLDAIKAMATDRSVVRYADSVIKATLSESVSYDQITWEGGVAPAAGDAAEIELANSLTLTIGSDIAADSVIVKGTGDLKLTGPSLNEANFGKFDFIGLDGKVCFNGDDTDFVPATPPSTGVTYCFEGSEELTDLPYRGENEVAVNFGGTVVVARPVTMTSQCYPNGNKNYVFDNAEISFNNLTLGNKSGVTQNYTQKGGSITVNSSNAPTSTSAALLLGHWSSTVNYTITGGSTSVPNAAMRLGWDGTGNLTVNGGTFAATGINGNRGTVTLTSGTLQFGSYGLIFGSGAALNLNGGTLKATETARINVQHSNGIAIGGNTTIEVADTKTLTIESAITGSGVVTKTGAGKLDVKSNRPTMDVQAGAVRLMATPEELVAGRIVLSVPEGASAAEGSKVEVYDEGGNDVEISDISISGTTLTITLQTLPSITKDSAVKNIAGLNIPANASGTLVIMGASNAEESYTVTFDANLPADVAVSVSGYVSLAAGDGFAIPFSKVQFENGAHINVATANGITIPNGATVTASSLSGDITNNGTLNVTGTCTFKLINNGTANFKNGAVATVSANDQSIHGTVNIESGAKFINATNDAVWYGGTVGIEVWGTLDMGATRWTMGTNTKIYAYNGARIEGTGQIYGGNNQGNFDPYSGEFQEYFIVSNYGLPAGETGVVTCSALTRTRATARVHIDERMTLKYSGEFVIAGASSNQIKVLGGGTMELSNQFRSTSGILVESGTLKIVAAESAEVTVSGPITGAGNVAFDGPGLITIGGVTTTGTCSVGTGEQQPAQIKMSAAGTDVEIPQNVRNALRSSATTVVFVGSEENGVSLQYGTTEASAISAHYVFDGGEHDLKYGRSSNSQTNNFGDDATPENPTILVKDHTVLRFVGHDLNGWQGAANINGIIRIADGGEIVAKDNSRNTFYYRQQFYFEPGSKLTIDMSDTKSDDAKPCFRPFGGVNAEAPQFYMPASEENSAPAVVVAKDGESKNGIFLAKDATKGVAFSIGSNSTLQIDAELSSYDSGDPIGKFGEGTVVFNGAISQYTGTITLHAGTIKSKNAFGEGKVVPGDANKKLVVSEVDADGYTTYSLAQRDSTDVYLKYENSAYKYVLSNNSEVTLIDGDVIVVDATHYGSDPVWHLGEYKVFPSEFAGHTLKINSNSNLKTAILENQTVEINANVYHYSHVGAGAQISGTGTLYLGYVTGGSTVGAGAVINCKVALGSDASVKGATINGNVTCGGAVVVEAGKQITLADNATLTVITNLADGKVISGVATKVVKKVVNEGEPTTYTYSLVAATPDAPITPGEGEIVVPVVPETGIAIEPGADVVVPTATTSDKIKVVYNGVELSKAEGDRPKYVNVAVNSTTGAIELEATEDAKPTVSAMAMPTTQEEGDLVSLTITPIPGLFYSIVTCDTPNGSFTGGDGEQATTGEAKTLSIAMPDAPVKYFKVRVKATR